MTNNLVMIDGISGSGKEGRIQDLQDYAEKELGLEVTTFYEPKYYREEILKIKNAPIRNPEKELELFIKSRKKGLTDYEYLLNKQGHLIIGNRGFISTEVYQSLQGIPLQRIREQNAFYPTPGLAMILLCDPEIALQRIKKRNEEEGKPLNLDEQLEKIEKLHNKYIEIAKDLPYAEIINTNGRPEAINLVLQSHLNNYLGIEMNKAIFLDKDGTIVDNSQYPEIIPTDKIYQESFETLRNFQEKGYKLFIISSQPWVARGRMTPQEVENVFKSVATQYKEKGITINDWGYCIHGRDKNCPDKKPQTRLFEQIIKKYNINTTRSYMIGDMDSDITAGQNIGLKTIRIKSNLPNTTTPRYTINNIKEAKQIIK
ncbi:HAD-IIIA family hydrolase [Candidatus Woesearchaeota archaeon]|nr:HAD-IIIA family hydrolase [Candidatus Woesearchaeota archaeon]